MSDARILLHTTISRREYALFKACQDLEVEKYPTIESLINHFIRCYIRQCGEKYAEDWFSIVRNSHHFM